MSTPPAAPVDAQPQPLHPSVCENCTGPKLRSVRSAELLMDPGLPAGALTPCQSPLEAGAAAAPAGGAPPPVA